MRLFSRAFAALAVIAMLAGTALAGEYGAYRDEFKTVSYSGSAGSFDWTPWSWVEVNDDGNIDTGVVHVHPGECDASNCLHIHSEGSQLDGVGASRQADTSVFSSFELCWSVHFIEYGPDTEAQLVVEKKVGDGGWHTLKTYTLHDDVDDHPCKSIGGPYQSTTIRFTVSGYVAGEAFIDDVELKGLLASETTTTTAPTTTTSTKATTTTTTTSTKATTTTTRAPVSTTTTTATTPTTAPQTTSTTVVAIAPPDQPPPGPPAGSGIRQPATGLQVAFQGDLFGEVRVLSPDFVSVDHGADFRIVAEVIEAGWVWIVVLVSLVAWAIVAGLEKRRRIATSV